MRRGRIPWKQDRTLPVGAERVLAWLEPEKSYECKPVLLAVLNQFGLPFFKGLRIALIQTRRCAGLRESRSQTDTQYESGKWMPQAGNCHRLTCEYQLELFLVLSRIRQRLQSTASKHFL